MTDPMYKEYLVCRHCFSYYNPISGELIKELSGVMVSPSRKEDKYCKDCQIEQEKRQWDTTTDVRDS